MSQAPGLGTTATDHGQAEPELGRTGTETPRQRNRCAERRQSWRTVAARDGGCTMAGTDDRPDDDGPGPEPDPDGGPDGGPTPDDADPPVPDDEGEQPDHAPPNRRGGRREHRSTLELVTVSLTAAAFIVGSVFSFWSVAIARDALNDTRRADEEEALKDLARISFDVRADGDRVVVDIRNRSTRPFMPDGVGYEPYDHDARVEGGAAMHTATLIPFGSEISYQGALQPCTQMTLTSESLQDPTILAIEEHQAYLRRSIVGRDSISMVTYSIAPGFPPTQLDFDRIEDFSAAIWGNVSLSPIEDC